MTLVIIPARMGSSRLPGKPLLKIGDKTLIERCVGQAKKAGFEPWVATDSSEIAALFPERAVMTDDCASGTDRVAAAAEIIDPEGKHKFVVNYQGDMPFLDPEDLKGFVAALERSSSDILTAYCSIGMVKCDDSFHLIEFKRTNVNCHVGLYGYTRRALRKFAAIRPSITERTVKLEQMRDPSEFSWEFYDIPAMPIEINTQADLDRARSCLM